MRRDLPGGAGEESVNERGLERGGLELLDEGGLVEGDAGGECLGDNALALGNELGGESGEVSDVGHAGEQQQSGETGR